MHYFTYKKGELHAEGVPVRKLAETYGTPLYIYSHSTLTRHFLAYQKAFSEIPHIICFALKANSNAAVIKTFAELGGGADVVSGGELYRALRAGVSPRKIVYAGVGKTEEEIRYALGKGILMFNLESDQELREIDRVAGHMKKKAPIALRINPDIDPKTHPYISTGLKKHKFGIPIEDALEYYMVAKKLRSVEIVGIHKHIGSQITEVGPFIDALNRTMGLVDVLGEMGIPIRYLDIGGGLGIRYNDEEPPQPADLASRIIPLLKNRNLTVIVEPGRSLVGNAGIFVTKVLYIKQGEEKDFVIVDGGMNDLIRPTLYSAYHAIMPVVRNRKKEVLADVVGPLCESGDFLGKGRKLPGPGKGDLLAVMSAGAYGFTMSSNYNSRRRVAEVMVRETKHELVKARETLRDLVKGEHIPGFLR
jgi:diaminopimelate decarboxylase